MTIVLILLAIAQAIAFVDARLTIARRDETIERQHDELDDQHARILGLYDALNSTRKN